MQVKMYILGLGLAPALGLGLELETGRDSRYVAYLVPAPSTS